MDMYNVVMFFVGLTVLTCLTLAETALAIRYFMAAPISVETHAAIKRLYSVVL